MSDETTENSTPVPPPLAPPPGPGYTAPAPPTAAYVAPVPLKRIPVPPAVAVLAIITLAALVFALGRLPGAVSSGIGIERAHKYLAAGNGASAVPILEGLSKEFPISVDIQIDLIDAYEKAKRPKDAAKLMNSLNGLSVSREQSDRLDEIGKRLDQELGNKDDGGTDVQGDGNR